MVTNIRQGLAQVKDDLPRIDGETVSGTESRMKKGMLVRAVVGLTYAVREIYDRLVDLNSATPGGGRLTRVAFAAKRQVRPGGADDANP